MHARHSALICRTLYLRMHTATREREQGGEPICASLSPLLPPCGSAVASLRRERRRLARRARSCALHSSPLAIGVCLRVLGRAVPSGEGVQAREIAHRREREQEAPREGGSAAFCTRFLFRRPLPFLSLSSGVRAEPKRESGDESESARERGGTSRRQRERGSTRKREGQQERGRAACAWGSCRGASFCFGAC